MESDDAMREALRPLASEGFGVPSGWVRIRQADVEAHESLDLEAVKDFIERHDGRVDEPPVYQSRAMGSGAMGRQAPLPPFVPRSP
jgi:hypothetical protein